MRPDDSSRETCPTVFFIPYEYEFSTVAMEMHFHESLNILLSVAAMFEAMSYAM